MTGNRWIDYCIRRSFQRRVRPNYSLTALLVKGGSVLAEGYNRPATKQSFRVYNPRAPHWTGMHAEVDCLSRVESARGAVLYVGGCTASGNLITTKPCELCTQAIVESDLKGVVWHTTTGVVCRVKPERLIHA